MEKNAPNNMTEQQNLVTKIKENGNIYYKKEKLACDK